MSTAAVTVEAVTATYISADSIYLSSLHKSKNLLLKSALSFRRGFATNPWNTSSLQLKLYDFWWYNYLFFALVERHVWPCRAWSQGFFLRRVLMRGVNRTGYLGDTLTVFRGKHSSNSCCGPDCKQDGSNKVKVGMVKREYAKVYAKVSHGPRGTPRPPPPEISFPSKPPPRENLPIPLLSLNYWTLK